MFPIGSKWRVVVRRHRGVVREAILQQHSHPATAQVAAWQTVAYGWLTTDPFEACDHLLQDGALVGPSAPRGGGFVAVTVVSDLVAAGDRPLTDRRVGVDGVTRDELGARHAVLSE
jgi:hypothetical protein